MNIPWALIIFVAAQLTAALIWGASEHARQQELEHRLAMHMMENRREMDFLQERVEHMDSVGTRGLQILDERQTNMSRRIDDLTKRLDNK